jgi:hypothetical protein
MSVSEKRTSLLHEHINYKCKLFKVLASIRNISFSTLLMNGPNKLECYIVILHYAEQICQGQTIKLILRIHKLRR